MLDSSHYHYSSNVSMQSSNGSTNGQHLPTHVINVSPVNSSSSNVSIGPNSFSSSSGYGRMSPSPLDTNSSTAKSKPISMLSSNSSHLHTQISRQSTTSSHGVCAFLISIIWTIFGNFIQWIYVFFFSASDLFRSGTRSFINR